MVLRYSKSFDVIIHMETQSSCCDNRRQVTCDIFIYGAIIGRRRIH